MRIAEVKNRFKLSAFNGYRDILITIAADHVEDHPMMEILILKDLVTIEFGSRKQWR